MFAFRCGAAQAIKEEIPGRRGIADAVGGGDLAAQSAPLEVVYRPSGLGVMAQLLLVKLGACPMTA